MAYNYHWAIEQKFTTRSSINQINYLNNLIAGLKADGDWNKFDRIWLFAIEARQQAVWNLINPESTTCTEVNAPTWAAKQGYTGNGISSYLDSNYNPSTQGVHYLLNDCCIGVYSRSTQLELRVEMGHNNAANNVGQIAIKDGGNLFYGGLNSLYNTVTNNSAATSLWTQKRTVSTSTDCYRAGVLVFSLTITDQLAIPNLNFYILARNDTLSPILFSTRQLAFAFACAGSVNQANINIRFQNYMTRIGSQV